MRVRHLLILFCCFVAIIHCGRVTNRNFPLLEIREISTVKLIYEYENVIVPSSSDKMQNGLDDLIDEIEDSNFVTVGFNQVKELLLESAKTLQFTYRNFIKSTVPLKEKNRFKRSWEAFGNALKWAGGVMNSEDRNQLDRYLRGIYENQTRLEEKMNDLMTQRHQMPNELKAERNYEFIELQKDLKRLNESATMQELKKRFDFYSKNINGILSTYVNNKLDSSLIDENLIMKISNRINDTTSGFACNSPIECIRNSEPIIELKTDGDIIVALKIPITETNSFELYEVVSTPVAFNDHLIILKPQHKYYAHDNVNNEIIAFNENYKQSCFERYNELSAIFCKTNEIITNVNMHDCMLTAIRDKIVDAEVCANDMELIQLDNFAVVKFDKKRFWIYSESSSAVNLKCKHAEDEVRNITGVEIIDMKFGCCGIVNDLTLVSYAMNENQHYVDKFTANISKESFREVINTMTATVLRNPFFYDLDTMKPIGLKEKIDSEEEEAWEAKNLLQEKEIKVLHSEHTNFIIIALVLAVGALLFIVFRRHKSILILSNRNEVSEEEDNPPKYKDDEHGSDMSLNIKSGYKL